MLLKVVFTVNKGTEMGKRRDKDTQTSFARVIVRQCFSQSYVILFSAALGMKKRLLVQYNCFSDICSRLISSEAAVVFSTCLSVCCDT